MGRLRPSQNMKLLILSILALLCAYAMAGDCTTWVLGMKGTKVTCASGNMCIALCMNTAGTKVYTQSCDTGGLCSSGSIGNGQCKYKSTTSGGKKVTVTGFCSTSDIGGGTTNVTTTLASKTCTAASAPLSATISLLAVAVVAGNFFRQ